MQQMSKDARVQKGNNFTAFNRTVAVGNVKEGLCNHQPLFALQEGLVEFMVF